uniref:Aminoacyl-histidine dipeptidase n=1 Tax=Tetraselmis sp. GSL018 TaxID=582737 RepID=A0A061RQC2_9CHLO
MASVDSRGSELPTVANNSQIVEQLGEPASVWLYFSQLSQIPRRSGCEADVLRMLEEFATERQFECRRDAAGNTVISRPGSGTGREAPTVVIQNHVDMVCVKGDTSRHDFSMDPIRFVRDGGWGDDWLTADDTTLGSDNGIGVAIALSVLDLPQEASLPPIEALFTVDEETGLTGVQKLDPGLVTGRTLLNLDTEQWGEICVGSAGTGTTEILLPVHREAPAGDAVCMQLEVSGLLGGHSGAEIQCDRANAVKLAARAARRLLAAAPGSQLVDLAGGELRNSIPRRAAATLLVAGRDCSAALQAAADASRAAFLAEYGTVETALQLSWREAEAPPWGPPALRRQRLAAALPALLPPARGAQVLPQHPWPPRDLEQPRGRGGLRRRGLPSDHDHALVGPRRARVGPGRHRGHGNALRGPRGAAPGVLGLAARPRLGPARPHQGGLRRGARPGAAHQGEPRGARVRRPVGAPPGARRGLHRA